MNTLRVEMVASHAGLPVGHFARGILTSGYGLRVLVALRTGYGEELTPGDLLFPHPLEGVLRLAAVAVAAVDGLVALFSRGVAGGRHESVVLFDEAVPGTIVFLPL